VQVMGGLVSRIRRFVDADGAPLAHGFFAIGDSHTCTNPLYGRGSSLAVLQATLVADALERHPRNGDAAARMYEESSRARVEPWYDVSVLTDLAAMPQPDSERGKPPESGAERTEKAEEPTGPAPPRLDMATLRRIAGAGDPELSLVVARLMSLLLTPQEVFGDPAVLERLATAAATERPRDPTKPPRPPLTRDDLLAAGAGSGRSAQPSSR